MSEPDPNHKYWLETIEAECLDKLNEWETNFIESIRGRFDSGWCKLSDKQAQILERIYTDKTK